MDCPKCRTECRVLQVEETEKETHILYTCANPRCENYKQQACEETMKKEGA